MYMDQTLQVFSKLAKEINIYITLILFLTECLIPMFILILLSFI